LQKAKRACTEPLIIHGWRWEPKNERDGEGGEDAQQRIWRKLKGFSSPSSSPMSARRPPRNLGRGMEENRRQLKLFAWLLRKFAGERGEERIHT